jgi:hypothetical protein
VEPARELASFRQAGQAQELPRIGQPMHGRGGRTRLPFAHRQRIPVAAKQKELVMPSIKLHLDQAEYDAIARFATELNVKPEAVAYAALNRLMLQTHDPELRTEIAQTWAWHRANLPLWSDSACSVHAYEGKADDEPEPSPYL